MSRPVRPVVFGALVLVAVIGMGVGLAAAGLTVSDAETPTSLSESEDDPAANLSELETVSQPGAEIAPSLHSASGETVVILSVERTSSVGFGQADTASMQADTAATVEPVADELDTLSGVTVRNHIWTGNLLTVSVDLDSHDIEELAAIDGVERVVPNVEFERPEPVETTADAGISQSSSFTFGLEQLDIAGFEAAFDGERGANATISIVDDGLSNPDEGHPDLNIAEKYLIQDGDVTEGTVLPGPHGEHVAGTAAGAADPVGDVPRYGVAPEAELLKIDVFGDDAGASFEDIAIGLEISAEEGADVAGFSLGAASDAFTESTFEQTFTETVEEANAAGTVVSVSAGNEGQGTSGGQVTSPATQFDAFSVGGSNEAGDIWSGSSGAIISNNTVRDFDGELGGLPPTFPREFVKPDVSAAGQTVLSAGPLGGDIDDPAASYSFATGTSMAQPHIAGAVALLQSVTDEQVGPKQIESALAETAEKPEGAAFPSVGERDIRFGTGIINVTAAALALDGAQTIDGNVTDSASGEAILGAAIESEDGALTSSREGGAYTIHPTSDPVNITVDEFGYTAETATVGTTEPATESETVDFELEPELDVDLIQDPPAFLSTGDSFEVVVEAANADSVTIDLTDASDVNEEGLDITALGEDVTLGEPVDLSDTDGEVVVSVQTAVDLEDGSILELSHSFSGMGDEIVVETGPTEILDELAPPVFEVSSISVQESVAMDEDIVIDAEIENVGQQTGTTETLTAIQDAETSGDEEFIFFPPDAVELEPGESQSLTTNFGSIADINDALETDFGPSDEFEAVQQVGFGLDPSEEPAPSIDDEATAPFTVEVDGPFFDVSALNAPAEADPGEEIDVNATVTNLGESGTQNVSFVLDGEPVATEELSLDTDDSELVEFTNVALPDEDGIYTHGVFSDDDSETAEITVGEPAMPEFELSGLEQPDELTVSEDIVGSVNVTNVGDASGTADVAYITDIDDLFILIEADIETVELEPGETVTVSQNLGTFAEINAALGTEFGPGDDVLTGFQVGQDINPFEEPEPDVADELAQNLSVVEEEVGQFFEVTDLDAPEFGDRGGEIDVTATVTNTGDAAGTQSVEFVFDGETVEVETDVSLAPDENQTVEFTGISLPDSDGIFEHGVVTANDSKTAGIAVGDAEFDNLTIVESDEFVEPGQGEQTLAIFDEFLPPNFQPEVVEVQDVDETVIDTTDVFVFHDFGTQLNESEIESIMTDVEDDDRTNAVYLEQRISSNAISERSNIFDTPEESPLNEANEAPPVEFEIQEDHPIFAGVGESGETVEIHSGGDGGFSWFEGADGQTLATVGDQVETGGPSVSVEPDSGVVLLASIATTELMDQTIVTEDYSDAAGQILANAVSFAAPEPPAEPIANLSGLNVAGEGADAVIAEGDNDIAVNVTNVGGAGDLDVNLTVGPTELSETVSLDTNETTTVTFENATSELVPNRYNVEIQSGGTTLVRSMWVSVDILGDGTLATDTTGDGLLNDVTGDGEFDIADVQALFENLDAESVQNNAQLFDFAGTDAERVSVFDIQGLFTQSQVPVE